MENCTVVVLDFETTGLSPFYGDRAIEIGAVLISDNGIVDRFQSLMNPGMRISGFIEDYTGITNRMLSSAPPVDKVMTDFHSFIGQHHLVAHNAGFDCRFLDAELDRISKKRVSEFVCSMLLSRRIYPDAPNHKLETLVRYKKLKTNGVHHRALADAEMTGHLWVEMVNDLHENFNLRDISFDLMRKLSKVPKTKVSMFLKMAAEEQGCK
jgi:DNA polymerase-3 subunit epsilon